MIVYDLYHWFFVMIISASVQQRDGCTYSNVLRAWRTSFVKHLQSFHKYHPAESMIMTSQTWKSQYKIYGLENKLSVSASKNLVWSRVYFLVLVCAEILSSSWCMDPFGLPLKKQQQKKDALNGRALYSILAHPGDRAPLRFSPNI